MNENNKLLPVRSWCNDIEEGASKQIEHLSMHPKLYHHIAIMPDCHQGYGMPIGGVIAAIGAVLPNAVGVDIGCGMCALKTSLGEISGNDIKTLIAKVKNSIPLGFEHRKEKVDINLMPSVPAKNLIVVEQEFENARTQLGTLGGGNHFIEFQKDERGHLWVMIHSGSRNLGKQVADFYNRKAKEYNLHSAETIPSQWDLCYLPTESEEGKQYIEEMNYCINFAFSNRVYMMNVIKELLFAYFRGNIEFNPIINIAHNYAAKEYHFSKDVWIHRKGATFAGANTVGIIPGSQGSQSYIVAGKGNPDSFESCSHGAGRKMGRNQAVRNLDLQEEIRKLDKQGIVHGIRAKKDLDEASGAYKDINKIIKLQQDLVSIQTVLQPIGVIKA